MATIGATTVRDFKVIGLISFGHMLSHFYFLVLPPILPLIKAELGVSYAALGLLMTGYGLAAGVLQTPVGFLVDRIGGRPALVCGVLLQGLCIVLMGFTDSYWQLLVLYSLAGAANTVYHPADYAIMTASVAEQRLGRAYSFHLFSGNFGWAITPAVMVGLTALWGWHSAFVIVGALGIAYALFVWTQGALLDDDIASRRERDRKAQRAAAPAGELGEGLRLLLSFPILMCFFFFVCITLGFTGIRNFFVAAMDLIYGTPLVTLNAALSGFLLGSAIGILAGGVLADRYGARIGTAFLTLMAAGLLVVLVGAVALPVSLLIAVLSLSGFLQGLLLPTRDLLVRSVTPDGSMGKVMGFLSTGTMLGSGVVPVLFGWLLDVTDPAWVFWVSAVFIAAALFSFVSARDQSPVGGAAMRRP